MLLPSSGYSFSMFWDSSKSFEEFSKTLSENLKFFKTNLKFLMKFFEKIKKNFWKIFKVCWLLWKLVPAFWNFPGFRGGDVPPVPPWSRYCEYSIYEFFYCLVEKNFAHYTEHSASGGENPKVSLDRCFETRRFICIYQKYQLVMPQVYEYIRLYEYIVN